MITRSYCSSWTCSIIWQSMQYLRRNPQDAGNPNIPWSCTSLLQKSQSAASGHISVPHTRQPRPWVRGVKGSAEFLRGEKEGCCHFPVGDKTQHTHLTENTKGHDSEWEMGLTTAMKKKNHPKTNWVSWKRQKIDQHRKLSWTSKWKSNFGFPL